MVEILVSIAPDLAARLKADDAARTIDAALREHYAARDTRRCANPDCTKGTDGGRAEVTGAPKRRYCCASCRTHAGYRVHGEAYKQARRERYAQKKVPSH